jgi:hypothetical protein
MNQKHLEILKDETIEKFQDPHFQPLISSLIPSNQSDPAFLKTPSHYIDEYKTYSWKRLEEIWEREILRIFGDVISGEEIYQGSLGSCYLLCALIGMSRYEQRIRDIIVTESINSKGVYSVKFLIQGEYKIVTVDDYIPCNSSNSPAFSRSKNGEVWLLLIEKAWAKLNDSCYMKTWLGTPNEALTLLSEAPCIYEYTQRYIKKGQENILWEKIKTSLLKGHILCADTDEVSPDTGLVSFHAYSIIKAFDFPGVNIKLILLRNPWGDKEWIGKYSKKCLLWTDILKTLVNQELKFSDFKKDFSSFETLKNGTFFMAFEDFIQYFAWTFFSMYEENYYYCYSKFVLLGTQSEANEYLVPPSDKDEITNPALPIDEILLNKFSSAYIEISCQVKLFLCLHQPQKRFQDESNISFIGQIIIVKFSNDSKNYSYVASDFINSDKIYLNLNLQPGIYHIFFRSLSICGNLVLSTYADYPVQIHKLDKKLVLRSWIKDLCLTMPLKESHRNYFDNIEKSSYSTHFVSENNNLGFGYFYYYNGSKTKFLKVEIKFESQHDVLLWNYDTKLEDNIYIVTIKPMSEGIIYLEYLNLPWVCKLSWSHVLKFI